MVSAQTPDAAPIKLPAPPLATKPVATSAKPAASSTPSKWEFPSGIQLVRYQYTPPRPGEDEKHGEYQIQVIPPGLERFTRLDNDTMLFERIRQETLSRDPNERVEFPESPILSRERYRGRGTVWEPRQMTVEPNVLFYRRLFFEQKNAERYGWDLAAISPVVSLFEFWFDFMAVPMRIGNHLCDSMESNAGYCLPGDPVPLLLYPPEVSVPGSVAELGTIVVLMAMFP